MAVFLLTLAVSALVAMIAVDRTVPLRYSRRAASTIAALAAIAYFVTFVTWASPLFHGTDMYAIPALVLCLGFALIWGILIWADLRQSVGAKSKK